MSYGIDYRTTPKLLVLEHKYRVLAAIAFGNRHHIRHFIYTKIAEYYDRKYMKQFMSR